MPAADLEHLVLLLTVQIAVIIGVSRLLGILVRRIGQPQVIGEVIAGILLGPSFFGWVAPELSAALFPAATLPYLKVLAELGIIFFMFLIGLELNPATLRERGSAAAVISGTSIVVPFALGAAAALALYGSLAGAGVSRTGFAVFLGAAMAITAFPVLARILIERGLLRSRLGAMTLTAAAVDDVAGWCLLPLVAALGHAGPSSGLATIGLVLCYLAAMALAVRPLLGRFAAFYDSRGGMSQNLLAGIVVLLLLSALATQWIGIHALFGGFVLGAVMPKHDGLVRELSEKMEDFATVFFLPVYFAYTGLRTEIGLLDTPGLWLICAALIGLAVLGKFGGSLAAARLMGLSWRESAALGALLNTRGLIALIILNVGLDLGLITPTLFAMMVLMAIITTAMTAPALALIDPHGELQPDAAALAADVTGGPGSVLVPVALSASGPALLDVALALSEAEQPRVYALHVARPVERGTLGAGLPGENDGGALAPLLAHARERSADVRPLQVTSRTPAEDICEVARLKGARLIVMGWHKPVFSQSVLGGTLDRILRQAPADIAILIDKGLPERIGSILLPYIGGAHDHLALVLAVRLARRTGASLTLLHFTRPSDGAPGARETLAALADDPATGGRSTVITIAADEPVDFVIAEAASHDITLLGVGEEWHLAPQLFGLRSERVAVETPSSLLIVRAAAA